MDEYRIPTEGLPACSDLSSMRILSGEDLQEVLSCYTRYAEKNHGVLKKTGEEIRAIAISDTQVKRVGMHRRRRTAERLYRISFLQRQ